jgi:hypothetical protein
MSFDALDREDNMDLDELLREQLMREAAGGDEDESAEMLML